jgi:peptidoglycan/LPS O-acetylase OafA/YrhL
VKSFIAGIILLIISITIPGHIGSIYSNVLYLTLCALSVALWFPFFSKIQSYKTRIGSMISCISILSYAMFLTNLMMVQIIDVNCPDLVGHSILAYFVYWLMTFAVSYLLYVFVEKPFVNLRDKITT